MFSLEILRHAGNFAREVSPYGLWAEARPVKTSIRRRAYSAIAVCLRTARIALSEITCRSQP
jgi:hypothetical protein